MPAPRFEPVINLGSLILTVPVTAVIPFLTYLVHTNSQNDVRISLTEQALVEMARRSVDGDARTREAITELKTATARLNDRLTDVLVQTAPTSTTRRGNGSVQNPND